MKKILLFSALFCCLKAFAQHTLNELYATLPVEVVKPYIVDTVDSKNKKFDDANLLKLNLTIPEQTAFTYVYQADTAGFFRMEPFDGKPFVQLFSFYVQADGFCKANVTIESPNMLEIYVNDQLTSTKRTKEDSIPLAKDVTAELTPYPRSARVVIKLFCDADCEGALKITVKNESKDGTSAYRFAPGAPENCARRCDSWQTCYRYNGFAARQLCTD